MTIKEPFNNFNKNNSFAEKSIIKFASNSKNFNEIPPIIGIIVADQYGNTVLVLEYDSKEGCNYGPIKTYITEDTKNFLEVDLISMYFSSFKVFATQTNIKNLSHLEIYGSNLKIQLYFLFDEYMIILFLNSNTNLTSIDINDIIGFFEEKLNKYHYEFKNFNATSSKKIFKTLERNGKKWLEKINRTYLHTYENLYLKKHEVIERFMNKLSPIIQNDLFEYLENIPEDIMNNLLKEIKNKIQDHLFEFNLT
ncbi:MAG: hypothetical protein ACXACC_09905 [Promethearchaeota archaeon]